MPDFIPSQAEIMHYAVYALSAVIILFRGRILAFVYDLAWEIVTAPIRLGWGLLVRLMRRIINAKRK